MRTYKDIEVKYYDTKGDVHVRCSVPVTEDALVHFELMQSHYCKLSFKLGSAIYFKMGDFIVTDYGRFELVDNVKPKDDGTLGYSYELEFDAYYRKWKNKRLKYMPNSGSPEGTFTLTSNIITHANIIKDNLDFLAKASKSYLYDPNYTGKGSDYTFVVDASVDSTKSKVITYSNSSILDAIANIAQTFECEWWVEGNLVHFGTCENTNEVVDFKDGENIVSMSSSQSQASYANRVYAFGAARNLPSGYKQNSSADVTKNGVVEKRLMLPTLEECSAENKKLLEDNGFELKNGCLQVKGLIEDEYVEGVTTNDDIYPRNLIKTSNVTYYEKDVEDESTPEEGDYIKRTFYRVKGLTIVDADGNKTGDMAFRSSYILSGKTLHIIFQSGSLNGMDFECQFNPDGESEILRDANGSPILKDGKEQINPAAQVFEIVANEDYGRFLPDTVLHPKDGDTFVLYNWDSTKLGNTLVTSSANELLTDAIKNLKKSMIDPTTYTCTAASDYSYNDGKGQFHFEGDRVNLFNKGYDMSFRASRIIGYELHLDVPFDSVKYTVGEKPAYSRLNAMSSQIEELVFNGQSYLNKGGSGNSIYIIKSYDTTVQPTDFNVFSAKRVENSYLHKDKTDAANFLIKFLRGLQVGDYSALSGGDWSLDELFRSHLTTDYLNVRMKAIFETLEILHTDTLGGELFITPVGSNRILKVEEVNVTYDGVSQKAYRCYFLGEQDGSKVENKWKVGDQARSKSFNLTQGKFHNVGNHYYWRLVIGVSTETVEIDGKKYHYVDLSDIDKDAASDEPMVDDILNQCGNRTDITRQSCLVFSAVDTYSPCITLYHGVNGYTFNNKEYVDYGVNHSTGKAFFHVYGDMYFGDRPTSANNYEGESYVKFDSETKKVTIKGDLDIKSTYDGKTLDKYIADKSLDKNAVETIIKKSQTIIDLQNQIDGAIETWFYDGVPTLSNAPAIGWATDNDKKTHLGDLYYDNKTGKAYRFAKDGSTYEWIIITDTELTKALKDSSQALKDAAAADKKANGAQATANTKRRIFGSQPVPPYDVNDMWVNATYPNDGSTYKNEILKCSTAKAEGEKFDIADWKLASKYTDDTKAEEAKKAAEKAQEEIKTTQSNLNALGTTVTENKKTFDSYVKDGYLEPSEIAAMAQDSKRLEDAFAAAEKSYNEVKGAEVLKSTKELTDLNTAFTTLSTAKTELVTYLSDISTNYNKADTNGKAAIVSAVGTKFTNFQSAYSAFYDKLGLANAYITSKIYGDLKQNITDLAGYKYLKDALGQTTDIDGGLVMTTLLALRDGDGNVQSGINGAIDPNRGKKSIATWWGGQMVDKDYNSGNLTPATSLIRFDGSGYLANGAIWWDVSGKVHADPTSFIISEKNLGAYLTFFEPTWKEGSAGTSVADLVSLKPNAPFSKLGVSGDATFEGAISFHGIKLTYDSKNKAIKIDGNLYTTGGITAYGAGASTTGGGGLNGSVKSYSNALKLTSESLSEIASAYSIKALDSRISSLEGGSAMNVSVSGSGNAVTAISKSGTTISVTKGTTFLTSHQSLASYLTKTDAASLYQPKGNYLTAHQSLDGYVNAITTSGSGNAITSVSKSGKGITFTKGATFLTSHQSLSAYLKSADAANTYLKLSGGAMTGNIRYKGSKNTFDMITFVDNNADTYGNGICIGGGGLTIIGGGESASEALKQHTYGGDENMIVANDVAIDFFSNVQNGWNSRKVGSFDTSGYWNGVGFKKDNSNDSYVLLGGGGHKAISSLSVNYASSAGSASSVAWSNVSGRPTKLSQFTNDSGYITSSGSCAYATNADKVDGVHVTWAGELTSTTYLTAWEANGSALRAIKPANVSVGNSDKLDGIHANGLLTALSNSDKGISITVGGTTKSVSNISVNYASSAGNADTVDGIHAAKFPYINNSEIWRVYGNSAANALADNTTGLSAWAFGEGRNYSNSYLGILKPSKDTCGINAYGTIAVFGQGDTHMGIAVDYGFANFQVFGGNRDKIVWRKKVAFTDSNVASATKLQTPRTIWGQSFDGTGNVNGTIYINNSDSENGAIILNNNVNTHARISAIKDQVVFNTGAAIRFGATNWDYGAWAGLKYDTVANAIYLGIADGTVFNYNVNKRSNGTLKFPGITTITPDPAARIGGSGGDLYLGNANNSNWVKVQDMCSQVNSSYWSIRQLGSATFKSLTVNDVISCDSISVSKNAVIAGNLSVNGLINNKGILPTNYEVNNKGTSCYVSADALCSGITSITDSIQVNQVTVQYSNDSGNSWTNYSMSNDAKFNLYANNAGLNQIYLGHNVITGNNDTEKLAQVKKNELMVTFEISNNCYSQVYFASVDISNGIDTICTVECLNNSGAVVRSYTKNLNGWNQINYINISEGNAGYGLGSDYNRYIRFRFAHNQNTTALRNTVINKIRIFAFTKYSFPTDRFMGHTGHIYDFDYNMNTYFPNSILAKGGVTAYQSSDIRLKQDLRKLDYLGIIKAMGGTYGFAWKKDNTRSIGWIAQHVLCNPHLKDIVETDEKGYYKINYWSPKLIATAFGAIEQVGDEVSRLKARVVFLELEVQRLSGDKEDCNKKRLDNKNINSLN